MSNVEKFTSNKATVETRHNEKQDHHRVYITTRKRRIGPIVIHLRDGDGEAADAARVALERAVKRKELDLDDLEHEDGEIVVQAQHEGTKRAPTATKAKAAPKRDAAARSSTHMREVDKGKPVVKAAKGRNKGEPDMPALPNGELTRELETQYRSAKKQYHIVGDALRERHEAVAAVAAEG